MVFLNPMYAHQSTYSDVLILLFSRCQLHSRDTHVSTKYKNHMQHRPSICNIKNKNQYIIPPTPSNHLKPTVASLSIHPSIHPTIIPFSIPRLHPIPSPSHKQPPRNGRGQGAQQVFPVGWLVQVQAVIAPAHDAFDKTDGRAARLLVFGSVFCRGGGGYMI